jgi:hypothetical protein
LINFGFLFMSDGFFFIELLIEELELIDGGLERVGDFLFLREGGFVLLFEGNKGIFEGVELFGFGVNFFEERYDFVGDDLLVLAEAVDLGREL